MGLGWFRGSVGWFRGSLGWFRTLVWCGDKYLTLCYVLQCTIVYGNVCVLNDMCWSAFLESQTLRSHDGCFAIFDMFDAAGRVLDVD